MERIRFITHRDKKILLSDMSGASPQEVADAATIVRDIVTQQPRGSVLILSDLTGAQFDKDAVTSMKEAAAFDRPHVKRSAFVGAESLPKEYYEGIRRFSQRDFPTFATREEALEWLVKD